MPPVAARFERPIVLPVREGVDPDAGLRERLVGLTAPFRLVAFADEPLVCPFEVGGPCELALHVGVGFEFGELVQLVERQLLKSADMSRVSCGILAIFNRLRTNRSLRPVFSAISLTRTPGREALGSRRPPPRESGRSVACSPRA